MEVQQHGTNTQASAFDRAHDAWEMKKLAWDVVGENIPGFDRAHSAFQDGMIGKEPKIDNFSGDYWLFAVEGVEVIGASLPG